MNIAPRHASPYRSSTASQHKESGRHAVSTAEHILIVCWALNDPGNGDRMRELVEHIEAQREIPGVLTIESGPRTKQVDWEGPVDTFDYAMVLTFDNFDSVRAYPPHPIHQKLVATILRQGSNIRGFWIDR